MSSPFFPASQVYGIPWGTGGGGAGSPPQSIETQDSPEESLEDIISVFTANQGDCALRVVPKALRGKNTKSSTKEAGPITQYIYARKIRQCAQLAFAPGTQEMTFERDKDVLTMNVGHNSVVTVVQRTEAILIYVKILGSTSDDVVRSVCASALTNCLQGNAEDTKPSITVAACAPAGHGVMNVTVAASKGGLVIASDSMTKSVIACKEYLIDSAIAGADTFHYLDEGGARLCLCKLHIPQWPRPNLDLIQKLLESPKSKGVATPIYSCNVQTCPRSFRGFPLYLNGVWTPVNYNELRGNQFESCTDNCEDQIGLMVSQLPDVLALSPALGEDHYSVTSDCAKVVVHGLTPPNTAGSMEFIWSSCFNKREILEELSALTNSEIVEIAVKWLQGSSCKEDAEYILRGQVLRHDSTSDRANLVRKACDYSFLPRLGVWEVDQKKKTTNFFMIGEDGIGVRVHIVPRKFIPENPQWIDAHQVGHVLLSEEPPSDTSEMERVFGFLAGSLRLKEGDHILQLTAQAKTVIKAASLSYVDESFSRQHGLQELFLGKYNYGKDPRNQIKPPDLAASSEGREDAAEAMDTEELAKRVRRDTQLSGRPRKKHAAGVNPSESLPSRVEAERSDGTKEDEAPGYDFLVAQTPEDKEDGPAPEDEEYPPDEAESLFLLDQAPVEKPRNGKGPAKDWSLGRWPDSEPTESMDGADGFPAKKLPVDALGRDLVSPRRGSQPNSNGSVQEIRETPLQAQPRFEERRKQILIRSSSGSSSGSKSHSILPPYATESHGIPLPSAASPELPWKSSQSQEYRGSGSIPPFQGTSRRASSQSQGSQSVNESRLPQPAVARRPSHPASEEGSQPRTPPQRLRADAASESSRESGQLYASPPAPRLRANPTMGSESEDKPRLHSQQPRSPFVGSMRGDGDANGGAQNSRILVHSGSSLQSPVSPTQREVTTLMKRGQDAQPSASVPRSVHSESARVDYSSEDEEVGKKHRKVGRTPIHSSEPPPGSENEEEAPPQKGKTASSTSESESGSEGSMRLDSRVQSSESYDAQLSQPGHSEPRISSAASLSLCQLPDDVLDVYDAFTASHAAPPGLSEISDSALRGGGMRPLVLRTVYNNIAQMLTSSFSSSVSHEVGMLAWRMSELVEFNKAQAARASGEEGVANEDNAPETSHLFENVRKHLARCIAAGYLIPSIKKSHQGGDCDNLKSQIQTRMFQREPANIPIMESMMGIFDILVRKFAEMNLVFYQNDFIELLSSFSVAVKPTMQAVFPALICMEAILEVFDDPSFQRGPFETQTSVATKKRKKNPQDDGGAAAVADVGANVARGDSSGSKGIHTAVLLAPVDAYMDYPYCVALVWHLLSTSADSIKSISPNYFDTDFLRSFLPEEDFNTAEQFKLGMAALAGMEKLPRKRAKEAVGQKFSPLPMVTKMTAVQRQRARVIASLVISRSKYVLCIDDNYDTDVGEEEIEPHRSMCFLLGGILGAVACRCAAESNQKDLSLWHYAMRVSKRLSVFTEAVQFPWTVGAPKKPLTRRKRMEEEARAMKNGLYAHCAYAMNSELHVKHICSAVEEGDGVDAHTQIAKLYWPRRDTIRANLPQEEQDSIDRKIKERANGSPNKLLKGVYEKAKNLIPLMLKLRWAFAKHVLHYAETGGDDFFHTSIADLEKFILANSKSKKEHCFKTKDVGGDDVNFAASQIFGSGDEAGVCVWEYPEYDQGNPSLGDVLLGICVASGRRTREATVGILARFTLWALTVDRKSSNVENICEMLSWADDEHKRERGNPKSMLPAFLEKAWPMKMKSKHTPCSNVAKFILEFVWGVDIHAKLLPRAKKGVANLGDAGEGGGADSSHPGKGKEPSKEDHPLTDESDSDTDLPPVNFRKVNGTSSAVVEIESESEIDEEGDPAEGSSSASEEEDAVVDDARAPRGPEAMDVGDEAPDDRGLSQTAESDSAVKMDEGADAPQSPKNGGDAQVHGGREELLSRESSSSSSSEEEAEEDGEGVHQSSHSQGHGGASHVSQPASPIAGGATVALSHAASEASQESVANAVGSPHIQSMIDVSGGNQSLPHATEAQAQALAIAESPIALGGDSARSSQHSAHQSQDALAHDPAAHARIVPSRFARRPLGARSQAHSPPAPLSGAVRSPSQSQESVVGRPTQVESQRLVHSAASPGGLRGSPGTPILEASPVDARRLLIGHSAAPSPSNSHGGVEHGSQRSVLSHHSVVGSPPSSGVLAMEGVAEKDSQGSDQSIEFNDSSTPELRTTTHLTSRNPVGAESNPVVIASSPPIQASLVDLIDVDVPDPPTEPLPAGSESWPDVFGGDHGANSQQSVGGSQRPRPESQGSMSRRSGTPSKSQPNLVASPAGAAGSAAAIRGSPAPSISQSLGSLHDSPSGHDSQSAIEKRRRTTRSPGKSPGHQSSNNGSQPAGNEVLQKSPPAPVATVHAANSAAPQPASRPARDVRSHRSPAPSPPARWREESIPPPNSTLGDKRGEKRTRTPPGSQEREAPRGLARAGLVAIPTTDDRSHVVAESPKAQQAILKTAASPRVAGSAETAAESEDEHVPSSSASNPRAPTHHRSMSGSGQEGLQRLSGKSPHSQQERSAPGVVSQRGRAAPSTGGGKWDLDADDSVVPSPRVDYYARSSAAPTPLTAGVASISHATRGVIRAECDADYLLCVHLVFKLAQLDSTWFRDTAYQMMMPDVLPHQLLSINALSDADIGGKFYSMAHDKESSPLFGFDGDETISFRKYSAIRAVYPCIKFVCGDIQSVPPLSDSFTTAVVNTRMALMLTGVLAALCRVVAVATDITDGAAHGWETALEMHNRLAMLTDAAQVWFPREIAERDRGIYNAVLKWVDTESANASAPQVFSVLSGISLQARFTERVFYIPDVPDAGRHLDWMSDVRKLRAGKLTSRTQQAIRDIVAVRWIVAKELLGYSDEDVGAFKKQCNNTSLFTTEEFYKKFCELLAIPDEYVSNYRIPYAFEDVNKHKAAWFFALYNTNFCTPTDAAIGVASLASLRFLLRLAKGPDTYAESIILPVDVLLPICTRYANTAYAHEPEDVCVLPPYLRRRLSQGTEGVLDAFAQSVMDFIWCRDLGVSATGRHVREEETFKNVWIKRHDPTGVSGLPRFNSLLPKEYPKRADREDLSPEQGSQSEDVSEELAEDEISDEEKGEEDAKGDDDIVMVEGRVCGDEDAIPTESQGGLFGRISNFFSGKQDSKGASKKVVV